MRFSSREMLRRARGRGAPAALPRPAYDYQKAPLVVQRFGDVKRLITQTLYPILTAYFRDVAQSSHMLDLLTKREEIQKQATEQLGQRFKSYDINVVAVYF
jgi:uncharacterized membrane protein YqiK